MLLEIDAKPSLRALSEAIACDAAGHDRDGGFPAEAFARLVREGFVADPPVEPAEVRSLLLLLAAVGRGDLSVGRIFEGHVNAVYLIRQFGSAAQAAYYRRITGGGGIFGVWNTDAPADPLCIVDGRFEGKKSFASGVDGLSHAIVTVGGDAGRQMLMVPTDPLGVDRGWWRPLGMRASGSHVADFTGLRVEPGWMLGRTDDYVRQP